MIRVAVTHCFATSCDNEDVAVANARMFFCKCDFMQIVHKEKFTSGCKNHFDGPCFEGRKRKKNCGRGRCERQPWTR